MTQPTPSRASLFAKNCLANRQNEIPVDVEAIAAEYGILVQLEDFEDEISGMLVIQPTRTVIGVNLRHHQNRRRFTVAHELGHFFLHNDNVNLFVDASPVFYRRDQNPTVDWTQEREANQFAAELLLPSETLRTTFQKRPVDVYDDTALRSLADEFGVSSQALLIRLTELDLVGGAV